MDIGKVRKQSITKEMEESYLNYAMSVIISRALPDVRDGLKPVHRRILFAMHKLGLSSGAKYRKSAAVVGNVLANYHPHGDAAVYETMVKLAQDFHERYPLVDGQGNFGSMDGDNAAAQRYCLCGDSLILTDKGIMPIQEISPSNKEKINYRVLNYNGRLVKARKFFDSGKHKIIEIETEQGYGLKGSYNHPVLCWVKNEFDFPTIEWKLLENITKNDYVLINRNFNLFSRQNLELSSFYPENKRYKNLKIPESMNKDLGFLLGALVAEGSFHQDKILFSNQDKQYYNKVKKIILTQFKGATLYEREIAGNCRELDFYHQKAVRFLINIGLLNTKSDTKEIPFSVLRSKKEVIKSFLVGLFEGDGSVVHHDFDGPRGESLELVYHSKSIKLINQLKVVLLNFGIVTTYPYQDKRNKCYKLTISGVDNIIRFKKEIGFYSNRKKGVLDRIGTFNSERMSRTDFIPYLNKYIRDNYKNSFNEKNNFDRYNKLEKNYQKTLSIFQPHDKKLIEWLLENRFFFNKVKSIKKLKKEENVYSIKVESNCHSFVANGFINHNTEAKMAKISEDMLMDIEKQTVDWVDNYDGTKKEPVVLPAKVPQLLINGTMGIAVGMATNIPPHNLSEVIDATIYLIDHKKATVKDLFEFIKGPDFPTGGEIYDKQGMIAAYSTGKGPIVMRGKSEIVEDKKGKFSIIINEIPYAVNKATLITKMADLVKTKRLVSIRDIRDESDRDGVRIVIELKNDAYPKKLLNQLYKLTDLQKTFHMNLLALVNGIQPQVLSLTSILEEYIKHRQEVVTRRTKYELDQAKERAHILEGLAIALDHIDAVIQTIKKSPTKEEAHKNLMKKFKLSDRQATAILEMRLQTLAGLEQKKIKDELKALKQLIKELADLLKSPQKILTVVKNELREMKKKYGDERKTRVFSKVVGQINEEDLVPQEECVIMLTQGGYIKRVNPQSYKAQKRGGKGIMGIKPREEDAVGWFISSTTHDNILFFTNMGRVFQAKAYEIPEASRVARGQALVNILQIGSNEHITAILNVSEGVDSKYLFMATENGIIKRTKIEDFANVRRNGLVAIKIKKDDSLKWASLTSGSDEAIMVTVNGQSIRFKESDARPMSRSAAGVKGIALKKDDRLVRMDIIRKQDEQAKLKVLVITANGYGKRTDLRNYKIQKRGGSGIKTANINDKTGKIVAAKVIAPEHEDLIAISQKGQVIKTVVKDISNLGRATQGVRIMKLGQGDKVASIACI